MAEEDRTAQYTDIQLQFLDLVKKYPVKSPETIVDYITSQGETVLEDPVKLASALSECEITPVRRRQILKHWFAEKGIEVAEELLKKVALPPDQRKEAESREAAEKESKQAKYSVDQETAGIKVASTAEKALTWDEAEKLSKSIKKEISEKGRGKPVTYVYDADAGVVRMAKEGEPGGTLDQAKELKKMADEAKGKQGEESPFIPDTNGNWILNPKAKITGVEFMAFDAIRRAQQKGEPVDPIEMLGQAAEKMKVYQDALGGGGRQLPDWMTDPAKFIQMVQTISGSGKPDETLKTELTELKKSLDEMREQRYKDQLEGQQKQIGVLTNKVVDLTDHIDDIIRGKTGRTEMDIIHEVATEGLGLAKTELSGIRQDIRQLFAGGRLPPPPTSQQREEIKAKLRVGVQTDQELEELGKKLFFKES